MSILQKVVEEHGFDPQAVVLTHGHIDHAGDAHLVSDHFDCEVWLHQADHDMLVRPLLGLSADSASFVGQLLGGVDSDDVTLPKPAKLRSISDKQQLKLAGIDFSIQHAPGHTEGSCLLLSSEGSETGPVFTGDVIFAGSIGRTDFPCGSARKMGQTLSGALEVLSDELVLLPGHGASTMMGVERQNNPYLQPAMLAQLLGEDV